MQTHSQIIDDLGGTAAVARIFGIKPSSVSEWRRTGIPKPRQQTLALMFRAKTPDSWLPHNESPSA